MPSNAYRVEINQQIHGSFSSASSEDRWVHMVVELPFPPYLGLSILGDGVECRLDHQEERHGQVNRCTIYWKADFFEVFLPSHKEIYYARLDKRAHRPIQEIVDDYLALGWEDGPAWKKRGADR